MELDAVVVGAGVVGLAVAERLARGGWDVAVVERHAGPGRETSARNSGVIHAGLYYPTGSLKHRTCIAGARALYAWCAERGVPHRRTGKLVVALSAAELPALRALAAQARANGVPDLAWLDAAEARTCEPAVPAVAALSSPATGTVDVAAYVRSLEAAARERGVLAVYRHAVVGAARRPGGFDLTVRDPDGGETVLRCARLVNAAGHGAPPLAASLGYPLDAAEGGAVPRLRQHLNRGRYYDIVDGPLRRAVSHHVYPLPEHGRGGLGVHLTVDLDGGLHLGPDTAWVAGDAPPAGPVRDEARAAFLAAGRRLLPGLAAEDLAPGQVGYRPKLQPPGGAARDFLVWHDRGYLHLGGIESPGLTASLALAAEAAAALGGG